MRTAWQCGSVAPMRADAALARLRDVSHRSASHRCSPRRSAPSRRPTLPHTPRFTSDGEWLCSGACGSGWRWHRADLKRHAMCSKPAGLICTTGLRFENLPASTADRGAPAGGPIGKLAQCAAGWVHASKHTAPRPRRSGALATSLCSFSPQTGPNNRYRRRFVSPS